MLETTKDHNPHFRNQKEHTMIDKIILISCLIAGFSFAFALASGRKALLIPSLMALIAVSLGVYSASGGIMGSKTADENLAGTPAILQRFAQWMDPESFITPKTKAAGDLKSLKIDRGILRDFTYVETTEGFYTVDGIASGSTGTAVLLSGIEEARLDDKLCIGSLEGKCYSLIGNR